MADTDKKFLDEDGVNQFAEETKKYIDKHADNADIHVTADDKAKIADVVNKANDTDVVHKTGNETIAGNKTFSNSPTVIRPNVGTLGYNVKLTFKRGEEISATNHSTFRVVDADNEIVSEVCTENYSDGKVAQVLNVRNTNDSGEQVQSSISHLLDKNAEQDIFFSTRNGKTSLGTSAYKWADVQTYLLNGKTPAYADDLTSKANDADVVHKSGNEIISGIKTFSNDIRISKTSPFLNIFSNGYIKGQAPTSNIYSGVRLFDDINSGSANTITGGFEIEYNNDGYNKAYISSRNYAGETHKFFTVGLRVPNDDIRSVDFLPSVNSIINLGTSTNKWKDVNTVLLNGKTPAYADDLSNYLPLSGGAMTGSVISRNTDDNVLQLRGGATYTTGSYLTLCGKDYSSSGVFTITAQDGTNACILRGIPSGSLTWGGKQVVTEPNSIPFHNAYPRCKYLGTSITDAQNTAIQNRTYDDLFIGDYWTINGVNWRIVAIDYYYNVGDVNFDKGNIIVMPDDVLYSAQMNATNTTAGAYAGSLMRTQNLDSARTIARNAFGSHLANHRIMLTSAVDASGPSNWTWYVSDGVELPNEVQIHGTRICGSALQGWDVATQKQQFPLMMFAPQFVSIRQNYWLQCVASNAVSSRFSHINGNGIADSHAASNSLGVRPAVTLTYI